MTELAAKAAEVAAKVPENPNSKKFLDPNRRIDFSSLGEKLKDGDHNDPNRRIDFSSLGEKLKDGDHNDPNRRIDFSAIGKREHKTPVNYADEAGKGKTEAKDFDPDKKAEVSEGKKEGLADAEKAKIKEETGWSDEVVEAIGSTEEYEIYKKAGLKQAEINGKKCLVDSNIDTGQKDALGRTNKERMEQGLAPLDKDGNPIELHHIGQHADSPLAELTQEQHRGKENYSVLHDTTKESEIDRPAFDKERTDHWKERAKEAQ